MLPPRVDPPSKTVANRRENEKARRQAPRSTRYCLEAPALFWGTESDRTRCIQTRTKNISRTGLYLYGEFDAPLGASFNFEVRLPAPVGGTGGVLRGEGKLVRKEALGEERIGFAVAIYQYKFQPA